MCIIVTKTQTKLCALYTPGASLCDVTICLASVIETWSLQWARKLIHQPKHTRSLGQRCCYIFLGRMSKKGGSGVASKAKKSSNTFDASNGVKHHGSAERKGQSETVVSPRRRRDTFSHSIYEKAAEIYRHLKGEIPSSQLPTFDEDLERRRAYSLAFGAKRCKFKSHSANPSNLDF